MQLDGRTHLLRTDRGGYVDAVLPAALAPGWHEITLTTTDSVPTVVRVCVVGPEPQVGIVSDIDDTVVVTHLPRPMIAAWNTFVLQESARTPVRGMAEFYRGILATPPGGAGGLPVDRRLERRADTDQVPVPQRVSRRAAAAHRLGSDQHRMVPLRAGAQAQPRCDRLARELPADAVAARR